MNTNIITFQLPKFFSKEFFESLEQSIFYEKEEGIEMFCFGAFVKFDVTSTMSIDHKKTEATAIKICFLLFLFFR